VAIQVVGKVVLGFILSIRVENLIRANEMELILAATSK